MKNLYSVAFLIFLVQFAYSGKIQQSILQKKVSNPQSNSEVKFSDSLDDSNISETVNDMINESQEFKENSLKKLIAAKKNNFLHQVQKNLLDNQIAKNQDNHFKKEISNHAAKLLKIRESNQAKCERNSINCRSQIFKPNIISNEEVKSADSELEKKVEEPTRHFLKYAKQGNLKKTREILSTLESAPNSKKYN